MKKEINPMVAVLIVLVIVAIVGVVGYQKLTARKVDSWETMPQSTKDKIAEAYGAKPVGSTTQPNR